MFTERFSQWVIEDRFAGPRPGWEKHGAQLVSDVAPYETAKLRMLNGAHSALAYCGLERGHTFVHELLHPRDDGRELLLVKLGGGGGEAEGERGEQGEAGEEINTKTRRARRER